MNNALTKLEFNGLPVRIELIEDEPWFVAKDVCDVLGFATPQTAYARLDADEKDVVVINDDAGRKNQMVIINEAGMYNLIFNSRMPQAKQFKRWVTHEVLPTLRKTGRFEVAAPMQQNTLAAAKQLLLVAEEHESRLQRLEERQEELAARPVLGEPPQGVLFPKYKPDHMSIRNYIREIGIKTKPGATQGMGNRLCRYCERVGIFYEKTTHGNRYPIPVLQEFFR